MPTSKEQAFKYDPEAAERGFAATAALRAAVGPSTLPNLNLEDAAIVALRVARDLLRPEIRREFELLHPQHFDPALLDRIAPAAWALWYANDSRFVAEATEGGARIRTSTLERASDLRERMLRVCDYMLGDHPVAGPIVAEIRRERGYADLAGDLSRLSRLYGMYEGIVSKGGAHYDAGDAEAANAASAQIVFELGESDDPDLAKAKDEAARAFVVLAYAYEEIRRWAAVIWNDPDFFPSLYSVRYTPAPSGNKDQGGADPITV